MRPNEARRRPTNIGSNNVVAADLLEEGDQAQLGQLLAAAVRGLPKGWSWKIEPDLKAGTVELYLLHTRSGRHAHVKTCHLEEGP